jgi:hypothetical protein
MGLSLMSDTYTGNGHRLRRDADADTEVVLSQLRGVLQGLRFGSVTIVVQDGVVVQIDRTEKRRVQPNARRLESLPKVVAIAQETHTTVQKIQER